MADWSFQDDGIEWLRQRPRALLGDEPGLGKSRQLLMAAEGRTLIVAPAMVLDGGVWEDEVARWRPDLDATLVPYSSITDREKTAKGGSRPLPRLRPEYRGRWDTVILDESHYIKGRGTTWTEAVQKLKTDRLHQATGTPIPNWAHELFIALRLLHPEEAKPGGEFGSYWRWVKKWFTTWQSRHNKHAVDIGGLLRCNKECHSLPTCEHWVEFHRENLGDLFLQRLRDDVLPDLPPLTMQTYEVPMVPAQAKAYKELKKDFITWLESGREIVAWHKGAQTVKLAKAATGLDVLDPEVHASGKLEVLERLLLDRSVPTLVVAHFRPTVEAIERVAVRRCAKRTAVVMGGMTSGTRRQRIKDFREGKVDVLVATIDTISEGLTLTQADTVIRVERSYRPSRNEQVIRRIHRIGQDRPVTAIDLVTKGTMDQKIIKLLDAKTDQQMKALRPQDLIPLA